MKNKHCRILLVEDDSVSKLIIECICKKERWNLTAVDDGIKASKLIENQCFDLILMDIRLPRMSGLDVVKNIRNKEKISGDYIPIIGISAYAMNDDKKKAISAGINEYITKPFDLYHLTTTVKRFLNANL